MPREGPAVDLELIPGADDDVMPLVVVLTHRLNAVIVTSHLHLRPVALDLVDMLPHIGDWNLFSVAHCQSISFHHLDDCDLASSCPHARVAELKRRGQTVRTALAGRAS